MVKRIGTLTTVTAFVSAISTPAFAQQQPRAGATATQGQTAAQPATTRTPRRGRQPAQPAQPAGGAGATAEDATTAEARREYNEGRRLFEAGQHTEALTHFQRAYELRSNPIVLLPIAEAQERLGQVPEAITTLERYLRDRADAPDRASIESRLATLRQRPATLHVESTPPGARVWIDGAVQPGTTPLDATTTPGEHTVRVELAGQPPTVRDVTARPGARQDVAVTLQGDTGAATAGMFPPPPTRANGTTTTSQTTTTTAAVTTTEQPVRRGVSPVVYIAGGLAAAGLVAGSVFGFMALSDRAEYDRMPSTETRDRGERNAMLSDVFFGTAILSAGVALVVFLSTRGGGEAAPTNRPAASRGGVRVTPTGNGLVVSF